MDLDKVISSYPLKHFQLFCDLVLTAICCLFPFGKVCVIGFVVWLFFLPLPLLGQKLEQLQYDHFVGEGYLLVKAALGSDPHPFYATHTWSFIRTSCPKAMQLVSYIITKFLVIAGGGKAYIDLN